MWTRMSRFSGITAAVVLAGQLCGCTGPSKFWRSGSRQTVEAPTLPMAPAAQEYQSYANAPAEPQNGQSYAGACGGCSRGSCGSRSGGCGSGACCSSGSCRTNLAVGPQGVPAAQGYGGLTAETPMGQQNSPVTGTSGYGGQKTCPVTDEPLGSMGPPVPVTVKGQTIYVCCQGCVETVQADPDLYLAKVMRERSGQ